MTKSISANNPPSQSNVIESPCIRTCCLDNDDVCVGCFRTIDEITGWHGAADAEKRQILHRATQRAKLRHPG